MSGPQTQICKCSCITVLGKIRSNTMLLRARYDRNLHPKSNDILSTLGPHRRVHASLDHFENCESTRTRQGFIRALAYILQLQVSGLLHCGPPCSSWVWVSRGSTKRTRYNVLGSKKSKSAAEGNTSVA